MSSLRECIESSIKELTRLNLLNEVKLFYRELSTDIVYVFKFLTDNIDILKKYDFDLFKDLIKTLQYVAKYGNVLMTLLIYPVCSDVIAYTLGCYMTNIGINYVMLFTLSTYVLYKYANENLVKPLTKQDFVVSVLLHEVMHMPYPGSKIYTHGEMHKVFKKLVNNGVTNLVLLYALRYNKYWDFVSTKLYNICKQKLPSICSTDFETEEDELAELHPVEIVTIFRNYDMVVAKGFKLTRRLIEEIKHAVERT